MLFVLQLLIDMVEGAHSAQDRCETVCVSVCMCVSDLERVCVCDLERECLSEIRVASLNPTAAQSPQPERA